MSWADLLGQWSFITVDLMSEYGVDVHDDDLMRSRPWCWLRDLILGLLSTPPAGYTSVQVDETKWRNEPVWRTRVQYQLFD